MSIQRIITAESGTAGAQVVQGASVGGDNIDLITKTGGGSITIDTTAGRAGGGTKSLRFTTTGTGDVALAGFTATDSPTKISVDVYLYLDALPTANFSAIQIRNSGSLATLVVQTNGRVLASFTGGSGAVLGAGDPVLAAGTLYRLALAVDLGPTGTGDSTVTAAVYQGGTPLKTPYVNTAASLGTTPLTAARIGKVVGGEATLVAMNLDEFRMTTGTVELLPPTGAVNSAPIASAGPDQTVEPWSTVTLTGIDSDTDGAVTSRAWTVVSGATTNFAPSGATCTFTAPPSIAGSAVILRYTVADSSGATDFDDLVVTILPVTERAVINGVEVPMQIRLS